MGPQFLLEDMTGDVDNVWSENGEQGKLSLLSREGVQQLQMLIFALAFFHVFSSFLTFSLGIVKMKRWESWEAETRTLEYQFSNDPRRFQLIHQTSFGRRHLKFWSEHRYLRLPACFLRQFFGSVYKVDYFTLRHGFIMAHFGADGSNFDFQKYIKRALEKDFGVVVGINLWIWMFSVLFIFLNAHVFYSYFWLPFIPLVMGTSMRNAIFTEGVVIGLKRWRAKAKKNIAGRDIYSTRPSLDASLDSSPSFGTLDASPSLDFDINPSTAHEGAFAAVEIGDGDDVGGRLHYQQHQKLGSFEGFDSSKI
ncbi:hypothetical protein F0562_013992 [Nyssa sinensis]|uniref:MLO-like protein n=1 Tax=Nyssa sinensis TaxID=561372 RepID=A0A5J4ZPR6_9ASTE|nr:hypothetical protein F0562_013992 [Nyssa sinensis]